MSIGTSSSIKGPFTTVSESVDDNIIGFFNLYEERSGTAYAIYAGYSSGFGVARLSSDYKGIEGQGQQLQFEGESFINPEGGIFKRDNKYYIVNAGMTQYAAADSLTGMWEVNTPQMWDGTAYKDIVDKNQTSSVFRVKTKTAEEYVCIGDSVGGESGEVRYIWLPLIFSEDGKVALRELSNWKLEKKDGEEDEQLATEADKAALMTYINKFVADITDDEEYEVSYPAAAVLKETYIKPYDGKTADIRVLDAQITAAGNLLTEENKAKDENAYHTLKNDRQTAEAAKNTALTTEVTKDQVTGATAALQEAITTFNNAMAVADARIVLAAAIAEADEIMDQEQCYTADSWQEFEEAYEAANAVTPTMTADEINTAAANLTAAQEHLVLVRVVTITGVNLDKSALSLKIGETKLTLGEKESIALKVNGTDKDVTWSSSNKKAADVRNGKVTAKKADKKAITITAVVNGVRLTCKVKIKAAPAKLIVKGKKTITVKRKKTVKLKVSVPKDTAGTLRYKTSNKKVATVDDKGKVKGIKKGTAKITVTAANNKKAKVTLTVKVK